MGVAVHRRRAGSGVHMAAMSDGDRLRMAADRLDSRVFGIRRMAREVQWMPTEGCDEHETTAALLRAVADDIPFAVRVTASGHQPPEYAWGAGPINAAALALADTILGAGDD